LSPQRWIDATNAVGIISKSGRYGGTYAHEDIAFEFASWISSEFKLYLVTEFKRLKLDENRRLSLEWNLQRTCLNCDFKNDYFDLYDFNFKRYDKRKIQIFGINRKSNWLSNDCAQKFKRLTNKNMCRSNHKNQINHVKITVTPFLPKR
jgi:hypothetical protein